MADLKTVLTKVINRRRLTGGEFSYVFRPTGESVSGKKAVWGMVKADADAYSKLQAEAGYHGEDEAQFDSRVLKQIPLVGFEEEVKQEDAEMEVSNENAEGGIVRDFVAFNELFRKVSVDNFERSSSPEESESFLRGFENVERIKRRTMIKNKGGKQRELFTGCYDVTFTDEESATKFIALPDVKYKGRDLIRKLKKTVLLEKIVTRMHTGAFSHYKRMTECLAINGEEEKQVYVFGLGLHPDEEVQEYFCGLESEFANIISARTVWVQQGGSKKFRGYLLGFEDEKAAEEFCKKDDKKFKGKVLKCLRMTYVVSRLEVHRKKANFDDHGDEHSESDANRKLVLLRVNEHDATKAETKIREIYNNVVNVYRSAGEQGVAEHIDIVTFTSVKDAKAALDVEVDSEFVRPVNVLGMAEYLMLREKVLEENREVMEKSDKKYKNIKDNLVVVDGNTIVITDPSENPVKKEKKEIPKDAKTATKGKSRSIQTQTLPLVQGALARRQRRGCSDWDLYVTVGNLHPKMKNLGKPSDMDICNYFLHNHKDVTDVKFISWTDIVFVKFKDVASAERFLGLSYVLFYGSELNRYDVETFLKKRKPAQKEEIAKVLLGKPFIDVVSDPTAAASTKGDSSTGSHQVELSTFPSKNSNVRDLFISELHLSEEDVGQPNWVNTKVDNKFTARLPVRLEENAIGYLVKKWNDLQINVEGETVSAVMANGNKAVKREGAQPKKPRHKAKKQKTNLYEEY